METLVLPAQDHLAYHQDSRSRTLVDMLHSPMILPRSQSNACDSSSQLGPGISDLRGNSDFHAARHSQNAASTFHAFRPSEASAELPKPAAGDCASENVDFSSSAYPNACVRSFSLPKGYGYRRGDGFSRKISESEDTLFDVQDAVSASPSYEKNNIPQVTGQGMDRYMSNSLVGVKGLVGTESVCRLEARSEYGRTLERHTMNRGENHLIARTCSYNSSVRDGSMDSVTILHRPKSRHEALPKIAKSLGGEDCLDPRYRLTSSSECESAGEAFFHGARVGETVSTRCNLYHRVKFHRPHGEDGGTPTLGKLKKSCNVPCPSKAPDSMMVCMSDRILENVSSDGAICRLTDGVRCAHPIAMVGSSGAVFHGTSSLSVDPEATFSCNTSRLEKGSRKDECASLSPPMNERWAGPAYSNSPPASSLPFPKFSIRQLRTSSMELPVLEGELCGDVIGSGFLSAPASPSRSFFTVASESSQAAGFLGLGLDVAYATKDLRRILNLDAGT